MTSPTQWTWVWASSRRWWRTGKPGVLQSMGSQSQTWLSDWTTTNHVSYPNLLFKMFMIFQLAVCSLSSLRLESPHLFPMSSLLMTPYPSSWTISSTSYFCLHSQDLPFTPKPQQSFLLAGSSLMALTTFHRHWDHLYACSSLPLNQNAISLRAVIRNTHGWTPVFIYSTIYPHNSYWVCYRFNNTIEHLSDTENCFRHEDLRMREIN